MSNPETSRSLWHQLLEAKISRRGALKGGLVLAGASTLPLNVLAAGEVPAGSHGGTQGLVARSLPPFQPIAPTSADDLVLPPGYRYNVVRIYGDEVAPGQPFGYNADFIGYFPIDWLEGGQSSYDGLLWVNHEYTNPMLQYGYSGGPKSVEQIAIERNSVGGSIFRVQRQKDGRWSFVADGHNRRVTGFTTCRLTGPAVGAAALKGATQVMGSVGNCAGGVTPWGTVLSCEENVDEYGAAVEKGGSGWDESYVAMHQGWVVEVDPYNPEHTPVKHTAMGRMRHENVAVRASAGRPVACYMGDDKQDSCIYKYVTFGVYNPDDRAANLPLLEAGKLYAADFSSGKWIRIDYDTQAALQAATRSDGSPLFGSQADVVADARAAALALKATPVDRPEDIEIHPSSSDVYGSLTNNALHGNYHGQIIRIRETDNNPESETFQWDFFATGGPQSGFSSPDKLVFDAHGNLWMVTDISSSSIGKGIYKFQGNNAMFFFSTEGPNAGKAMQFASGPVQCEMTGPYWTPDGSTLFVSVQHPGEDSKSLQELTSHWPNLNGDPLPRPGVVAITGFPGWGA